MIFNDITYYLLFLGPSVACFHLSPKAWRPWVLAALGFTFFVYYASRHFGGTAGALCVLIFVWEMLLTRLYRPGSRWCIAGIVQALAILVIFKYGAWLSGVAGQWGLTDHPRLSFVQVLGISFFTFEFIHFAADSYSGRIDRPRASSYAAFILFFPTMVAGPIKRFQTFGPQLEEAVFTPALASQGLTRILAGLAKKAVLADTFAVWSDRLQTPELYAAPRSVVAGWLLAYAFRIYFDFSAYSDIAIGSGNLFGLKVPENFNWPYFSENIAEFWRRWHISLGSWIYDYVFAPLSLAFGSWMPVPVALLITFTLCGIWHGAGGHFALWGLWHGALLAGYYLWRTYLQPAWWRMPAAAAVALTFTSVVFGYAFFALETHRAVFVIERILGVI
jgi:alginate O-acetyltransferase complex protein AlgI